MKKILVVVHHKTSTPGLIGQVLQAHHCQLELCCPAHEQTLPETIDDYDGVLVLGGAMSANDCATLPFIRAELDWIPQVLASEKPFLGICLGAQLLARVLGGQVAPHPQGLYEIGYTPVIPTAVGQAYFSEPMQVYQWHQEGFEVPRSAVQLAAGNVFANQAFRYGETAYGLQFHPEITVEMIHKWTTEAGEELHYPGAQSKEHQLLHHTRYSQTVERWLRAFLPQWLSPPQFNPSGVRSMVT